MPVETENQRLAGAGVRTARLWFLLLLWAWTGATALAASFTVSLDRDTIGLGEMGTLTMSFEGNSMGGLPALPRIDGLNFSDSLGSTSKSSFYNGVWRSVASYVFTVTPTRAGTFTIPSMTALVDGQTCQSQPVKLTVSPDGAAAGVTNKGNEQAFIRLVLKQEKIHVGEMMEAQFQLFLRDDVLNIANFQFTPIQAEGFTVGKNKEEAHTQTRIRNTTYSVIPFTMVFTAAKVGTLKLGPVSCQMDLLLGPVNIFGQPTRSLHVNLMSEPMTLEVLPLPDANKPASFNGAVGDYQMTYLASPTNVAVGDPITLSIQIRGRGALDSITLPDQAGWDKFKFYPPTSDIQAGDDLGLTGTRTFKLTVVPQSMDVQQLPPYLFSYFDPATNAYRTIKCPATPLVVRPSAASLPMPTLSGNAPASDNPSTNLDILHIKPFLGEMDIPHAPLIAQPWFLAVQGLPVAAWLALLIRRKQSEKLAANPRLRRQRQAERALREGLKELRRAAAAGEQEAFFATLFRLLQERLGERLDLPASAITEAVLDERLRPLGVDEGAIELARELFQACDHARYGRQNTNEELLSLAARVETALAELGRLKT